MTGPDLLWSRSDWCRFIRQELKAQGPALFSPHHNHNHIFTLLPPPPSTPPPSSPDMQGTITSHQLAVLSLSWVQSIVGLLFQNWQWGQKQDENPSNFLYAVRFGWFVPVTTILTRLPDAPDRPPGRAGIAQFYSEQQCGGCCGGHCPLVRQWAGCYHCSPLTITSHYWSINLQISWYLLS